MYDENNGKTKKGPTRLPQSILQIKTFSNGSHKLGRWQKLPLIGQPIWDHLRTVIRASSDHFTRNDMLPPFALSGRGMLHG